METLILRCYDELSRCSRHVMFLAFMKNDSPTSREFIAARRNVVHARLASVMKTDEGTTPRGVTRARAGLAAEARAANQGETSSFIMD